MATGRYVVSYNFEKAYNTALGTALSILLDGTNEKDRSAWIKALLHVLNGWMYQDGVYPPSPLSGILSGTKSQSVIAYLKNQAKKGKANFKVPDPWQCCDGVQTPAGLFTKLWFDEYPPLLALIDNIGWDRFHALRALVIVISDNSVSSPGSAEVLQEATLLADHIFQSQFNLLKALKPTIKRVRHGKQSRISTATRQKATTDEKIQRAIETLTQNGHKCLDKTVALEAGVSAPTVSRFFKKSERQDHRIRTSKRKFHEQA